MKPKIRLQEFKDNWNEFTMSDVILDMYNGQTPYRGDLSNWNGEINWISSGDLNRGIVKYSSEKITAKGQKNANLRLIPKGTFVMAITGLEATGTRGNCGILGIETTMNQSCMAIFPKEELLNSKFLFQWYRAFSEDLGIRLTQGTKQQSYNASIIKQITLNLPSVQEQEQLVSFLSSLDTLIKTTSKKIDSLKQIKVASLQSMFPQEGETKPRVRFKEFEGDWEKTIVGNLGATYSGLSGKTKDDFGQGYAKFVTFLNVLTNAIIDTSILEPVKVSKGEHQNEVKKGDLLFNTSSETPEEVGMCAVMDEELENVYLNSFCFGFRITDKNIDPTFIAYLMRSHIGRKIMSILAQGATRYNLSKNNFCKTELLLPKSKAEQAAIGNYFSSLDKQITLQTQRLEKLKQIKSACLDNMFV